MSDNRKVVRFGVQDGSAVKIYDNGQYEFLLVPEIDNVSKETAILMVEILNDELEKMQDVQRDVSDLHSGPKDYRKLETAEIVAGIRAERERRQRMTEAERQEEDRKRDEKTKKAFLASMGGMIGIYKYSGALGDFEHDKALQNIIEATDKWFEFVARGYEIDDLYNEE
jgi:hypothetical protein